VREDAFSNLLALLPPEWRLSRRIMIASGASENQNLRPLKLRASEDANHGHQSGVFPELPSRMADLFDLDERITNVENNLQSIQAVVKERI